MKQDPQIEVIQLAFPYWARVFYKHKRAAEPGYFRMQIPVIVGSFPDEAAAVVCKLSGPAGGKDVTLIRRLGGDFYRSVPAGVGMSPLSLAELRRLAAADPSDKTGWPHNPFVKIAAPHAGFAVTQQGKHSWLNELEDVDALVSQREIRKIEESDLINAETRIRATFEEYCLIDGAFYQRCQEPRIGIKTMFGELKIIVSTSNEEMADCCCVFRLDRMDDARKYVQTLSEAGKYTNRNLYYGKKLEVLRPDLLGGIDPVAVVKQNSEQIFCNVRPLVSLMPREGMLAFADLRDCFEKFEAGSATVADAKAFVATYLVLLEVARTMKAPPGTAAAEDIENFLEDADETLMRWRDFEDDIVSRALATDDLEALNVLVRQGG